MGHVRGCDNVGWPIVLCGRLATVYVAVGYRELGRAESVPEGICLDGGNEAFHEGSLADEQSLETPLYLIPFSSLASSTRLLNNAQILVNQVSRTQDQ